MPTTEYSSDCQEFFDTLQSAVRILVIKLYRLELERPAALPRLPCLDHEAMLHEDIEPHAAAYVIDTTDNLHEVVYIPGPRRLEIDTVSTMGEVLTRVPGAAARPAQGALSGTQNQGGRSLVASG